MWPALHGCACRFNSRLNTPLHLIRGFDRHCEQRIIQFDFKQETGLFVPSRNDVKIQIRILAARIAPGLCKNLVPPKQRAQGMPDARRVRSRAWCVVNTRVSHHGHAGNVRHSPRNGFNGLLRALPSDRAFLPLSPRGHIPRNLTPASGRQDHTTSPSASGALVFGTISVHRIP